MHMHQLPVTFIIIIIIIIIIMPEQNRQHFLYVLRYSCFNELLNYI